MRLWLYEYQAKLLLLQANIPVPAGDVVTTPDDAYRVAAELGSAVVIKAQQLRGRRIPGVTMHVAHTPAGARDVARRLLGTRLPNQSEPVRQVLVETRIQPLQLLYLAILTDYTIGRPVLVASLEGGKDPDRMSWNDTDVFSRVVINPLIGLHVYQAHKIASDLDFPHAQWRTFIDIIHNLYRCYVQNDAEQIVINPLAVTAEGGMAALESKIRIDRRALYRQPSIATFYDSSGESPAQSQARQAGIRYTQLHGQIGCLVNGRGLGLVLYDLVQQHGKHQGVTLACILDTGSNAAPEEVATGLRLILSDPAIEVALVNIFDGLATIETLMYSILDVRAELDAHKPIVIRLQGGNIEAASGPLHDADNASGLIFEGSLTGAVERAVQAVIERRSG